MAIILLSVLLSVGLMGAILSIIFSIHTIEDYLKDRQRGFDRSARDLLNKFFILVGITLFSIGLIAFSIVCVNYIGHKENLKNCKTRLENIESKDIRQQIINDCKVSGVKENEL
jgi:heme/copper-type cytochrome/quinol oxidase subunit 3